MKLLPPIGGETISAQEQCESREAIVATVTTGLLRQQVLYFIST